MTDVAQTIAEIEAGCPDDCKCEYECDRPYRHIAALEAELARLRAPVEGEVKSIADHLRFDAQKHDVALYRDAADLIQRLAGQLAEATARAETERQIAEAVELRVTQQEYVLEERRQRISDLIRDGLGEIGKREAAEARLREAVEVMRPFAVHGEFVDFHFPDDGDDVVAAGLPDNPITLGHFRRARAFLANLEDQSNGK